MNEPLTLRRLNEQDLTTRSLSLREGSVNEDTRSVEAVIATENPVLVFDMRTYRMIDEVLIARGAELPEQVSLLDSHARFTIENVRGSARDLKVDGSEITSTLLFAEDEDSERAWQKVKAGHITDVSVGYRSIEFVDIQPGSTERVNGRTYTAGERTLRITSRWQPREVSLVPIGADAAAKIREDHAALTHRQQECKTMNEQLRSYLESIGLRAEATEQEAWAFYGQLEGDRRERAEGIRAGVTNAAPEPRTTDGSRTASAPPSAPAPSIPPPADPPQDSETIRREAVAAERQRVSDIRDLAGDAVRGDLVEQAIREGWDTERASREFLLEIRNGRSQPVPQDRAPAGHVRDHDRDCTRSALTAGLMHRAGTPVIDSGVSDEQRRHQERLAEQGDRFRDMCLLDFCREAIRLSGGRVPHGREETIRAAVSTAELDAIFSTSANKRLLMSYDEAPDTTQGWVIETDVSDFKTNDRHLFGKNAGLQRVPANNEADHLTYDQAKESYNAARYGGQFGIDEQQIINDDMSALQRIPDEMGRSAARLRPDLVYAILLANAALNADSKALFHADHNNLGTTSTALGSGTLQGGIAAMGKQTQNGVNLNVRAAFLLVPQDLVFTGMELVRSAQIIIAGDTDTVRGSRNVIADLNIQVRADNRLGAAGVTDPASGNAYTGTATNWFLSAAAQNTIEVGYVAGTGRRPVLRSYVMDKGRWGIGWDVRLDIGAKALDFRGLYKATGAA
jgi:phage head maturation protease